MYICTIFKGIVSRDFRGLQMILMDRTRVPGIPLNAYFLLNFHIVFKFRSFCRLSFHKCTLTKVMPGIFSSPGLTMYRRSDVQ